MGTGIFKAQKYWSALVLKTAAVLFLWGCEVDDGGYGTTIQILETGTDLESLSNFSIKNKAETGQLSFITCEQDDNKETRIPYKITGGVVVVDTAGVNQPTAEDAHYALALEKFSAFWTSYNKINGILEINSLDGSMNCGASLAIVLKSGEILVKSKVNMDNLYGFQYQRKVLENDWALYKLK